MRSVSASLLALALTVLLCACVSNIPVWETVDDEIAQSVSARLPSCIVFAVPDGAVRQTFGQADAQQIYFAADGSYEISTRVFSTADPQTAMRALTGFDPQQLQAIKTTRFSLPEYQFAWTAATDEGEYLYRAAMLCDDSYCYALCFCVPAGSGCNYDTIQDSVFSSFGLYYDETL